MIFGRKRKKILIVDDEEDILIHLSNILRRANYEIYSAPGGKEAIDLVKNINPDLVILDIFMPDIDGSSVAAVLSEDSNTASIPTIFLTGIITKKEEALQKRMSGKHFVMAKPVKKEELLETINEIFSSPAPS